jgi:histidinol-phosphate aminotransferase
MLNQVTDKTKIIWICNPNNPTGTMLTHAEIKSFMERVSPQVLVVLDEAYAEYNVSGQYPDGLQLMKEHDNIILLRTFSKIYGLASLRIGFGIGHPTVIRSINQVREPFNTTRFAQVGALAAFEDQQFVEDCREANAKGITYLISQFNRLGFSYYPAHGNFIMVDVKRPAGLVFDGLLRKGIIVRGGHQLGFPTSLRVTVGSQQQNELFIQMLEQVIAEVTVQA